MNIHNGDAMSGAQNWIETLHVGAVQRQTRVKREQTKTRESGDHSKIQNRSSRHMYRHLTDTSNDWIRDSEGTT